MPNIRRSCALGRSGNPGSNEKLLQHHAFTVVRTLKKDASGANLILTLSWINQGTNSHWFVNQQSGDHEIKITMLLLKHLARGEYFYTFTYFELSSFWDYLIEGPPIFLATNLAGNCFNTVLGII
jgi:hypothetical protein